MAIHTVPWTLQSASHGAELFRQTTQSLLAATGVVGASDLLVTQNGTPNMSVNVATGQVWIPGTLGGTSAIGLTNQGNQSTYGLPTGLTTQGSYYSINDATVNLAISASNPTNPRIDLVCASVQDAFYSGATNTVVLQVITGTPAPSPVAPAPPANSVVLAQIAVAANATQILTANITDVRPKAGLLSDPVGATAAWGQGGVNENLAYLYARPQFQVHMNAAQSIPNSTVTKVAYDTVDFDTVDFDNLSGWSAASHNYTVPTGEGGLWLFNAVNAFANNGTGVRGALIQPSGAGTNAWQFLAAATDPFGRMTTSLLIRATAGTTVEVDCQQTSGGALNTLTGTSSVQFSGIRLG